ncbi:MerR family transcriptional regulator, partial [Acinetobacter baumannii]
ALQLTDVRTKMADLTRIEAVLSRLVNECHAQRGTVSCPLIDSLHGS